MKALSTMPISFPGLFGDWAWNPDPIALHIGHGIYWYGIILAFAMLCGLTLAMKRAKSVGLTEDHISDLVLMAVPCCIVGSRTYYVLFNLDLYRNASGAIDWGQVIAIWDGGIAMYGTVIVAFLLARLYTLVKKIPMGAMTDAAVPGLMLGQAIGRWANLINREAFGAETDLPWRMRLWMSQTESIEVHPTFLYESLWNFAGLALMLCVVSRRRKFDGENTWFYFLWYGVGRFWIEGLRTDSLYLFGWTLFGQPVRVSQLLSAVLAVTAAVALFVELVVLKRTPEGLYVNRQPQPETEAAAGTEPVADADPTVSTEPTADADPTVSMDPTAGTEPEMSMGQTVSTDPEASTEDGS